MAWDLYFIDALLLSVLIILFYKGYKKGVINQVIWLFSFIIAYFIAAYFCYNIADLAGFPVYSKNVSVTLAFIITFCLVVIVMHYLGKYFTKLLNLTVMGPVNSILGGLLNSLIYIVIVVSLSNVALFLIPKADNYLNKTLSLSELVKFEKWLMDQNYIDDINGKINDLRK